MEKNTQKPTNKSSSLLSKLFKLAEEIAYKPYNIDKEFKKFLRIKQKGLK